MDLIYFSRSGAISVKALVYTIIVIMGFVVAISIFFSLDFSGNIDRTACSNSVILKGSLPDIGGGIAEVKGLVPLKCKTEKSCVTDNRFLKGDCESLGKKHSSARLAKGGGEKEGLYQMEQIRRLFAEKMVNCWDMMGQGEMQVFKRDFDLSSTRESSCVVCSRIAFEEGIQNRFPMIKGTARYLIENKMSDSDKTYWAFLTEDVSSGTALLKQGALFDSSDRLSTEEKSVVFMEVRRTKGLGVTLSVLGITTGVGTGVAAGAYAGGAVGTAVFPGLGTAVGVVVGVVVGGITSAVLGYAGYQTGDKTSDFIADLDSDGADKDKDYYSDVFILNTEAISELGCGSIESIP